MRRLFPSIIILSIFGVVSPAARCAAQNVTNYDSLSDSYLYLFLLREPAIQKDLQLSAEQDTKLTQLNAKIDGPLLALRNWSPDNAQKKVSELVSQTQQRCAEILDDNQRRRIKRIMLRVRGVRCVLQPEVADQLMLTAIQRQQIQEALQRRRDELEKLRERLQDGESQDQVNQLAVQVKQQEQRDVLQQLTEEQKKHIVEILGRPFDLSQLGHVSFKAPELVDSSGWINSQPKRLVDLRGNVIALHFWAFG